MNPQPFGRYQLLKKLATGGMAEVWLARQTGIEGFAKNLVVKRILPHLSEDREFVEMFRNEALIAARFNHPNIAQVYEFGEANGTYYIAMEFVHGEDLGRVMRKAWSAGQWIARPLAIRIVANACEGLHYAHTRTDEAGRPLKVVHRDISPQNILISFEGAVKLVDFGIAKAADQASLTRSGAIKGKFAYMAPEQAAGKALDHRADIFAIGLVLYELLTGQRPLKRETELATLQAALECNIPPPSEVADVPPELDPVVMHALAKAADDRYRDARQFQIALEELLVSQRWVAGSVQLSELMETLFAERLAEDGRLGSPESKGEEAGAPAQPSSPSSSGRGRGAPAAADMNWEAPPGELAPRERPRSSTANLRTGPARHRSGPGAPAPSLSAEGNEWDAPLTDDQPEPGEPDAQGTPGRRRGHESTRRPTHVGARTSSRPEMSRASLEAPEPRRTGMRPALSEEGGEPPVPRTSRPGALALSARSPSPEEQGPDLGGTPSPESQPRRRTGPTHLVDPSLPPRRRSSSRLEMPEAPPRSRSQEMETEDHVDLMSTPDTPPGLVVSVGSPSRRKKALMGLAGVGGLLVLALVLVRVPLDSVRGFWSKEGQLLPISVTSNQPVTVTVRHGDQCGSPEPITELNRVPEKSVSGLAHIQDTLVLENKQQGIYKEIIVPDEPGTPKSFPVEFRMGSLKLKVFPTGLGVIHIVRDGVEIGRAGPKLDMVEGHYKLELRGPQLREPVPVEVDVKARETTEQTVNLSDDLN